MIYVNGIKIDLAKFSDGTFNMNMHDVFFRSDTSPANPDYASIIWKYRSEEELVALFMIVNHLRENYVEKIDLYMPYVPNARMDRNLVDPMSEISTLKYFCNFINSMKFNRVTILDPHSNVCTQLLDRVSVTDPTKYVNSVKANLAAQGHKDIVMFYPDEGAMKRYSDSSDSNYLYGMKKRDWKTHRITDYKVIGDVKVGSTILIQDDICSYGGTFLAAANELKKLGAKYIYLYVSHLENAVYNGKMFDLDSPICQVFTTDSLYNELDPNHMGSRVTVYNSI